MTRLVITLLLVFLMPIVSRAQSADEVIADFHHIHTSLRNDSCTNQQLISNRAMNLFLSDKIGTYLTRYEDLSFYKNNITFNAASGEFSLNHNLFQPNGIDNPVRFVSTVGVKANITNALATAFTDRSFTNELGMTINATWLGKPKTLANNCVEKNRMDAQREILLELIKREIKTKNDEHNQGLANLHQGALSDADFATIKQKLHQEFVEALREEMSRKFATDQYLELSRSLRYKTISTNWTTVSLYAPIILKRFVVAGSLAESASNKKIYPFEFSFRHTRFWETTKSGRIFLQLGANLSFDGVLKRNGVKRMNFDEYKRAGGTDSLSLGERSVNTIYVGNYDSFLTPAVKVGVVYFPPNSHIGVSSSLEQNIGSYDALNWTLGIPVVLINTIGAPAANFEFQLQYFDLTHSISPARSFKENITVNLSIGIPFSKIIY